MMGNLLFHFSKAFPKHFQSINLSSTYQPTKAATDIDDIDLNAMGAPAIYTQDDHFKAQIVDATHGNLTAAGSLLTLKSERFGSRTHWEKWGKWGQ